MIGEREARLLQELAVRDPMNTIAIVRVLDTFLAHQQYFCMVLELLGESMQQYHSEDTTRRKRRHLPHLATMPRMLDTEDGSHAEPQHKLYAFFQFHQQQQRELLHEFNTIVESTPVPYKSSVLRLSLAQIKLVTIQLCAALAFLHDQGVIHADIKPDNIVHTTTPTSSSSFTIIGSGSVKLVDFGNCIEQRQIVLYEAEDAEESNGGYPIQTLLYRAPEVATGLKISPAMDMWSLGCVLAECVTSTSLFTSRIEPEENNNSTPWTQDIVEQMEWLVTGGVPLWQHNSKYRNARYYTEQHCNALKTERIRRVLHPTLPLRHRLVQARQERRERFAEGEQNDESDEAWALFDDFVTRLLDIDPDTRLTPRTAFLHPFLQSYFPFQRVFAPHLSGIQTVPIDTAPVLAPDKELKKKRKEKTRDALKEKKENTSKKIKRATTGNSGTQGLQAALKLIVPIKEEHDWTSQ